MISMIFQNIHLGDSPQQKNPDNLSDYSTPYKLKNDNRNITFLKSNLTKGSKR